MARTSDLETKMRKRLYELDKIIFNASQEKEMICRWLDPEPVVAAETAPVRRTRKKKTATNEELKSIPRNDYFCKDCDRNVDAEMTKQGPQCRVCGSLQVEKNE